MATDGGGHWVTVWYSTHTLGDAVGADPDIFVSTSMDNGATWTAPVLLNATGAFDLDHDILPQLTTDGAGNWVVVWESIEDVDGTPAGVVDVFAATFILGVTAEGEGESEGQADMEGMGDGSGCSSANRAPGGTTGDLFWLGIALVALWGSNRRMPRGMKIY